MPNILCSSTLSMMSAAASDNSIIAIIRSVLFTLLCLWLARCVFKTLPSLAAHANVFNGCGAIMTAHWGIAHALAYCPIAILYLSAILAPNWPWCKSRLWEPAPFLWCAGWRFVWILLVSALNWEARLWFFRVILDENGMFYQAH
jgi:hypothetical protein